LSARLIDIKTQLLAEKRPKDIIEPEVGRTCLEVP